METSSFSGFSRCQDKKDSKGVKDLHKLCFVCKEEAKGGKSHKCHYGGVVCLSCRAFFRRAHHQTRSPKFHCKLKDRCDVEIENRRQCRKCRYMKCIEAGLKPDSVLDEDQKRVRFRRLYAKRKTEMPNLKLNRQTQEHELTGCPQQEDKTFEIENNLGPVCSPRSNDPLLGYTAEEDCWLQNQFRQLESAFRSVEAGADLMREFVMYTKGTPLPADHIKRICSVYLHRILRSYQIHPEFEQMSSGLQLELLERNSLLALGLLITKSESCRSGMEQLQDGFGKLDQQRWDQEYLPHFESGGTIRKVSLPNIVAQDSLQLQDSALSLLMKTIKSVSFVTAQPWIFKMNLLLAFTNPTHLESNKILRSLHHKYLSIYRRKLLWINHINGGERNVEAQMHRTLFAMEQIAVISPILIEAAF